jgi:hypothetical protein
VAWRNFSSDFNAQIKKAPLPGPLCCTVDVLLWTLRGYFFFFGAAFFFAAAFLVAFFID